MFYAVIAFSVLILTVPLSVKIRVLLSVENKKAYYSLFFLNKLRLNSGYLKIKKKYLVINYSDKKALAINLNSILSGNGIRSDFVRLEPLVIKYSLILGGDGAGQIIAATAVNLLNSIVYSILKVLKPYAEFKGDVIMTNMNGCVVLTEFTIGFCILILLETAATKLIGSIISYAKRVCG